MRRLKLLLLVGLFCAVRAGAVLTEKNLGQTLGVLRVELASTHNELKQNMERIEERNKIQHQRMVDVMQESNQVALMLYSQNQSYTFNLTYACAEAAQQYRRFKNHMFPFDDIKLKLQVEIAHYTHLIETLEALPPAIKPEHRRDADGLLADSIESAIDSAARKDEAVAEADDAVVVPDSIDAHHPAEMLLKFDTTETFVLDKQGVEDRAECVRFAKVIRSNYIKMLRDTEKDSKHYETIAAHLQNVLAYAQSRYREIQRNIFINGEESYFSILSDMPLYIRQAKRDIEQKYGNKNFEGNNVDSQWRGRIIFGLVLFVLFYFGLAFGLSNLIVRLAMKHVKRLQNRDWRLKMDCMIVMASFVLFSVVVMLVKMFIQNSFIAMASQLLVNFSWLVSIILVSLLIRLNGPEIKSSIRMFLPIVVLGFIVIVFRIIFIPNTLVALAFPPMLVVFTLWQALSLRRRGAAAPASDRAYAWVSLGLMCVATVMAWAGYVLMSVQVFIWWLFQLTTILTITCAYHLFRKREERKLSKLLKSTAKTGYLKRSGAYITHTWGYDMLAMMVLPIAAVYSVLLSVYWAAEVFDLTEICAKVFVTPFVDVEGVCRVSVLSIVVVVEMYFVFYYLNYLIKALYRQLRTKHLARKNKGVAVAANQANFTLFNNVVSIVLWGVFFIAALFIFHVPKSGLSLVTAGLATGLGFAMKDLLNNFFYGISLMTGRLRVGDWIECDGVRGKVDSITYQSTQVVAEDGSVMSFLNSTLFNQNFKNLTRNHFYVRSKIVVGVAYGSDINSVRKIIIAEIKKLQRKTKTGRPLFSTKHDVAVKLSDFGESSVDLVVIYWSLVEERAALDLEVKEVIYNALNANNIEIPFPQRDVHIIAPPVSAAAKD